MQKELPVHTLYIGSRDGGPFSHVDRQAVTDTVAAAFDCFTVIDASGFFHGSSVATMVIKIATEDQASVEDLALGLGHLLDQQAVGLEVAGRYRSITSG
jgi:hypothetical protein